MLLDWLCISEENELDGDVSGEFYKRKREVAIELESILLIGEFLRGKN